MQVAVTAAQQPRLPAPGQQGLGAIQGRLGLVDQLLHRLVAKLVLEGRQHPGVGVDGVGQRPTVPALAHLGRLVKARRRAAELIGQVAVDDPVKALGTADEHAGLAAR